MHSHAAFMQIIYITEIIKYIYLKPFAQRGKYWLNLGRPQFNAVIVIAFGRHDMHSSIQKIARPRSKNESKAPPRFKKTKYSKPPLLHDRSDVCRNS